MNRVVFNGLESIRKNDKFTFEEKIKAKVNVNIERGRGKDKKMYQKGLDIFIIGTAGLKMNSKEILFLAEDKNGNKFHISETSIIW